MLPRTIVNPLIGDKVTFLKTAAETNGEYILVEVELAGGGGNGLHYHTTYTETFEVLDGVLGIECEKEELYLQAGESAFVPLNKVHRFFNASTNEPVTFRTTIRPARQFEEMLRIAYGLACDGKTNKKGIPNIWYLALMFEKGESYLPGLPLWLQTGLFNFLARLARLLGKHRDLYAYYLEPAAVSV